MAWPGLFCVEQELFHSVAGILAAHCSSVELHLEEHSPAAADRGVRLAAGCRNRVPVGCSPVEVRRHKTGGETYCRTSDQTWAGTGLGSHIRSVQAGHNPVAGNWVVHSLEAADRPAAVDSPEEHNLAVVVDSGEQILLADMLVPVGRHSLEPAGPRIQSSSKSWWRPPKCC